MLVMNVKVLAKAESRRASQSDPSELLRMCMSAFANFGASPIFFAAAESRGSAGSPRYGSRSLGPNLIQHILPSKFNALVIYICYKLTIV